MNKERYMVLDHNGNPIARKGDEVNPYIWDNLIDACVFAHEERKNFDAVSIESLIQLVRKVSGGM